MSGFFVYGFIVGSKMAAGNKLPPIKNPPKRVSLSKIHVSLTTV
jgi:hypothetical protein